jgi:DNA-binding transcriptional LysR family regulator
VATQNKERSVQTLNAAAVRAQLRPNDWASLRYFLAVAEAGSFQGAARAESVSVNTVRTHVERLEERLGLTLLRRSRSGCAVSDAGSRLLEIAREMRQAGHASKELAGQNVLVAPGEVRIACSEGIGLLWLTPRLRALTGRLGGLTASLSLDYDLARDRSGRSDIVLTFERPADPETVVAKLATLHFMGFAAPAYIEKHGMPRSLDEARSHTYIEQVTPGVRSWLIDLFLGSDRPASSVAVRTNSSLAQLWAVVNGLGIAPMPTFVRALSPELVPLDPPLNLRFDLLATYQTSARASPAIRAAMAWLRDCFAPAAQPWFRDEFVHPCDFPLAGAGPVTSLLGGIAEARPIPAGGAGRLAALS